MADTEVIEQAVASFTTARDQERATMFNAAGQSIYSPEEHQRRLPDYEKRQQQHLAQFRARLDQERDAAQQTIEETDRALRALDIDPLDRLSGDELQVAAARRIFVEEDCERLS